MQAPPPDLRAARTWRRAGLGVRIGIALEREAQRANIANLKQHGDAITVSPTKEAQAQLHAWQQGSDEMYEAEAVAERNRNKRSAGVQEELHRWWSIAALNEGCEAEVMHVTHDTYRAMYVQRRQQRLYVEYERR